MASQKASKLSILILGLGELGTCILDAILDHSSYSPEATSISVLVRPSTIRSPDPTKAAALRAYASRGVAAVPGDLQASNVEQLVDIFCKANVVIHAGGLTLEPGTQLKVTQAVLAADTVHLYIPWQFGVDYDVIGLEGGQGMFSEQLQVRDLLRAQNQVDWAIVSCGIFMSLLFEAFWGIIVRDEKSGRIEKVRALGSWDDLLTATTAKDIGRCTAELLLGDNEPRNCSVYIASDTLTYAEFAKVVEEVSNTKIERELWTTAELTKASKEDPDDKIKMYRVVFSEGRGLAWPMKDTYNKKRGLEVTGFEQWVSGWISGD